MCVCVRVLSSDLGTGWWGREGQVEGMAMQRQSRGESYHTLFTTSGAERGGFQNFIVLVVRGMNGHGLRKPQQSGFHSMACACLTCCQPQYILFELSLMIFSLVSPPLSLPLSPLPFSLSPDCL